MPCSPPENLRKNLLCQLRAVSECKMAACNQQAVVFAAKKEIVLVLNTGLFPDDRILIFRMV